MIRYLNRKSKTPNSSLMRIGFVFLSFLCISMSVFGQNQVTGTVTDAKTGEPLPGVSVQLEGTSTGIISDIDGKYKITVPTANSVLVFSYVSYIPERVTVEGKSQIDISLVPDVKTLDDVVVIGYGTQRKKDLTGTVTSISGKDLKNIPLANSLEALSGRLVGVQITTTDGAPDAEMIVRVRGGGSVTGSNTPLYVVDGFPVQNLNSVPLSEIESIDVLKDASSTAIYGAQGANGVVLVTTKSAKGGRTTVSYSNFFQYKNLYKKLDVMSPYEFVNYNYEYAALRGTTSSDYSAFIGSYGVFDDLELYKYQQGHDYQADFFGSNRLSYQHDISVTGGTEKTKFSLSGNYNSNEGLIQNNYYNRLNLNFKLNHELSKNLILDFTGRITNTNVAGSGTSGDTYKVRVSDALTKGPVAGLSDLSTSYIDLTSLTEDELNQYYKSKMSFSELSDQYWKRNLTNDYYFAGAVSWNIVKGLTFRSEGGLDYSYNQLKNYWGYTTTQASNAGNLPLISWTKNESVRYRIANTLTYKFQPIEKHSFDILLGQEMVSTSNMNNNIQAKYFSKDLTPDKIFANISLSTGTNNLTTSSYVSPDDRLESFFGRVNYAFNDRYLISFVARTDGSSKFAEGHQWGIFPAAAIAWRVSQEEFMKSLDLISNLKARFSYGVVGNNNIKSSQYQLNYQISSGSSNSTGKPYGVNSILNSYYMPTNTELANPDLKWETTITRNVGLDFGFFKERLSGTLDLYQNTTKDLLITMPIAAPGYTTQTINVGQTSNKGIELTLVGHMIEQKDFTLSANFNIAFNRGKVDKLASGITEQAYSSGWASTDMKGSDDFRVRVGQPVGLMYGFVNDGYYTTDDFDPDKSINGTYVLKDGVPTYGSLLGGVIGIRPGSIKLKDLNHDGVIDVNNDRKVIGDATPKHTGGFGLNGTFKGFDFTVLFSWVYGNSVYNATKQIASQTYRVNYPNLLSTMNANNRYTYINSSGAVVTDLATLKAMNEDGSNRKSMWSPYSFGNATVIAESWAVEDGSFLRLQNITLGYTIPKKLTQKLRISQFRVFGTLNNVWVLTNYSGYDPEVSSPIRNGSYNALTPGVDWSSFPKSFAYTFGLNVTF